jgi:hypothetical protein
MDSKITNDVPQTTETTDIQLLKDEIGYIIFNNSISISFKITQTNFFFYNII